MARALSNFHRLALFEVWDELCVWCRRPLHFSAMEVDHLLPRSLTGAARTAVLQLHGLDVAFDLDAIENLAPSCGPCNRNKSARIAPDSPAITMLLESAKRKAPRVRRNAESYRKRRGFERALLVVRETAAEDPESLELLKAAAAEVALAVEQLTGRADVLVHPAFEGFQLRKLWLVNGTYLALAISAYCSGHFVLDGRALDERALRISKLHAELIVALEHRFPELDDTEEYAAAHVDTWRRLQDPVERVLRRLRSSTLVAFLDDFDRKLGEPACDLARLTGTLPPALDETFQELHLALLAAVREGTDEDWPRAEAPFEAAVTRYRQLLEGCLPADVAQIRSDELRRALTLLQAQFR